jgi:hypothetical protein
VLARHRHSNCASSRPHTACAQQYDQEGAQKKIDGPILASLRDYVRSISAEEDNDQLRRELLGSVTKQESQLTVIPVEDLLSLDLGQASELPYVLGVLKWV